MRTRLLVVCGAMLLLAACESTPEDSANTGGGGDTAPAMTDTTVEAPPADNGRGVEQAAVEPTMSLQDMLVQRVGDRVFFDFDRSVVRSDGEETLRRQARFLREHPEVAIVIEGHCDERGTREYNLALGARRANAAKNYLVSLGVEGDRIRTISYGKERPIVLGSNESAWAQNRVAISVIDG